MMSVGCLLTILRFDYVSVWFWGCISIYCHGFAAICLDFSDFLILDYFVCTLIKHMQ